jgi:leader peptidase (prepilin peptidase) / N-methyltransferase
MGHNPPMVVVICFVLGLIGGWFANRVVIRRITGEVGVPGPLLELAAGLALGAVAMRVGRDWALPGFLLFAWTLLVVAVIDAKTRRIPNRLTYPLTPVLLVLLATAALLYRQPVWAYRALFGGVVAFVMLLAVALVSPRGMGMGDVKLAAFIGVGLGYLGWDVLAVGVLAGFLLGGCVAMALLVSRVRRRSDLMPFGPYLAAGAFLALLIGNQVVDVYLQATGLR